MGFFGLFGGRRSGKTVAEKRVGNAAAIVNLANRIHGLQKKVVKIERDAPYIRNNKERERLEVQKIRLEREIERLEKRHHALYQSNKG